MDFTAENATEGFGLVDWMYLALPVIALLGGWEFAKLALRLSWVFMGMATAKVKGDEATMSEAVDTSKKNELTGGPKCAALIMQATDLLRYVTDPSWSDAELAQVQDLIHQWTKPPSRRGADRWLTDGPWHVRVHSKGRITKFHPSHRGTPFPESSLHHFRVTFLWHHSDSTMSASETRHVHVERGFPAEKLESQWVGYSFFLTCTND